MATESATLLADVTEQIQKFWAPLYTAKLRESFRLAGLVNQDYEGQIRQKGDTVYVSQIEDKAAELRTVGVDADTFASQKADTTRVALVANKRAVQAYDFEDLVFLQSQLERETFQQSMVFALEKKINTYLYSLVSPSTSSPDHLLNSVSTLDADKLADINQLAAEALWPEDGAWYGLVSPAYWTTMLKDNDLKSSEFVSDQPSVRGQTARTLMGFNLYRDNSLSGSQAVFFHRDFMYLAMQTEIQFKVSDLHATGVFGYRISADVVFGATLGLDGAKKHIKVLST